MDPDTGPGLSSLLPTNSCPATPGQANTLRGSRSFQDGYQPVSRPSAQDHRTAPNLTASNNLDFQHLQALHTALALQVTTLAEELGHTHQLAQETHGIIRGPASLTERTLRRTIMFTSIAAVKALEIAHTELAKIYSSICAANSVRQISLRSKQSDCSLFEVRLLVSHFIRKEHLKCSVFPSAFYALLSSTSHPDNIELTFETFSDICDALEISADHREAGVYRERRVNSNYGRSLRCVQVLGTNTTLRSVHGNAEFERKILLAQSMPTAQDSSVENVHVLHQPSTRWSEHDGTWEEGFQLKVESRSSIDRCAIPEETEETGNTIATRDIRKRRRHNVAPSNARKAFVLQWERFQHSPYPRDSDPHLVPGGLRVYFPAVVIRSIVLTKSAQSIFEKPISGKSLQSILCSSKVTL